MVSAWCLLGLGSCVNVDLLGGSTSSLSDLMPSWEEFDKWLLDDPARAERLVKRSSDPVWDNYEADRSDGGVLDTLVDKLKKKEFIGAIDSIAQHANKLASGPSDRQDQDVVVTVPQANVPQIVEDLGAVSMFCQKSAPYNYITVVGHSIVDNVFSQLRQF